MRKALCVGIDSYEKFNDLHGCVNDANGVKAVLERNGDGTLNFSAKLLCATSEASYINRGVLKDAIQELFIDESEIAVFYYAGHGSYDALGGYLCTSEVEREDQGLSLNDLMGIVADSHAQNKIVILDSCFSGQVGNLKEMQNYSVLHNGTTILAACDENQYSSEENGHGVFTSLLIEALYGGAMNLLGEVSPGSIYSYIDRSLGGWEQRPVFKANIKGGGGGGGGGGAIVIGELRRIIEFFNTPYDEYSLDPTYEPDKHEADIKEVNAEHEEIFSILQRYVKLNLVVPVNAEHMYFAAINHKSCKLTAQGQHYWNLVNKGNI